MCTRALKLSHRAPRTVRDQEGTGTCPRFATLIPTHIRYCLLATGRCKVYLVGVRMSLASVHCPLRGYSDVEGVLEVPRAEMLQTKEHHVNV